MDAYVLIGGQGAQFIGMGKKLYENSEKAKKLFEYANEILGFRITDSMFYGTMDNLKQTHLTQPSLFIYTTILALTLGNKYKPSMITGYSLGEYAALVVNGILTFEDGLKLISRRAKVMQKHCVANPSVMAMFFGVNNDLAEKVCKEVAKEINEVVVVAIYGFPVVIGGSVKGVDLVVERLKLAGASKAIKLEVGGAFHTPMMEPVSNDIATIINSYNFKTPNYPFYQNFDGLPQMDVAIIKEKLINQLITPVRWHDLINNMINDGVSNFIEIGPGTVLQGLVKNKVNIN